MTAGSVTAGSSRNLAGLVAFGQRPPDRLAAHLWFLAATLSVVALLGLLLRRGWRNRGRAQADLGALPAVPAVLPDDLLEPAEGLYVGTTIAGGWLDRVVTAGLGTRTRTAVRVTGGGVLLAGVGGRDGLWVPAAQLRGARVDSAHAGKVMGPGGLFVLAWQLGPAEVESGVRCDDRARHAGLVAAVEQLRAPAPRPPARAAPADGARALLVLEDGRTFVGEAYGARGDTTGEVVFATGMTGYQETLTDPSYHRQIVVQTAPHIGNTGVNDADPESGRIWVAGYVVRDPSRVASSWRSTAGLEEALRAAGVVGIARIDTRALTRHLRERGAMRAGITSAGTSRDELLAAVRATSTMTGMELASQVTTAEPYTVAAEDVFPGKERPFRVTALDLGLKRSTPAYLSRVGVETLVVPATTSADEILATAPDGVFLSNGPGDPAAAGYAADALRGVLDRGVPVFGICMGNQILARALGLGTYKLRYGHRGINSPVLDRATGRVQVTSHNHGFAVDAPLDRPVDTPFGPVEVSHVGLNDDVVEGLRCLEAPAFSVQYHPEAAPGPHDATGLFREFARLMAASGRRG